MMSRGVTEPFVEFVNRHPVIAAVLVLVAVRGIPTALGAFVDGAAAGLAGLLLIGAAVLLLRRHHWATIVGLNRPRKWKEIWLAWLPFAYTFLPLSYLIWRDTDWSRMTPQLIIASVAQSVPNAFVEEIIFRGLVLAILLARFHSTRGEITGSVLGSAILFGLWHPPDDPHWETNVAQWVYAAFAGVGFAGVALRTKSIWLGMAAHALLVIILLVMNGVTVPPSAPSSLSQIRWGAVLSVLIMLPWLFYGLFLIRNLDYSAHGSTVTNRRQPVLTTAG
jgi:membrane protease YdiL (CAAX protease family)